MIYRHVLATVNALADMTPTQLRAKYEELTGDPVIFSVLSNNRAMGMCKRCGIAFTAEVASRENGMMNLDHFTPGWKDRRPPDN